MSAGLQIGELASVRRFVTHIFWYESTELVETLLSNRAVGWTALSSASFAFLAGRQGPSRESLPWGGLLSSASCCVFLAGRQGPSRESLPRYLLAAFPFFVTRCC